MPQDRWADGLVPHRCPKWASHRHKAPKLRRPPERQLLDCGFEGRWVQPNGVQLHPIAKPPGR
jgi:hypothetical protein